MKSCRSFFGSLLAATLLVAPPVQADELETWDQEKVTALAESLSQSAQALRGALRRQPPPNLGQPGNRSFWALRDDVQTLVSASTRLHRALENGAGRDETFPTYRRLLMTARSAEREARRVGLGEPVGDKIEATADAIRRIRPYFEDEPSI